MPISSFQSEILALLAANRDPESYVAGGTPLNRSGPRFSNDIDVFHDRQERVERAAEADFTALTAAGLECKWLRRQSSIQSAEVRRGNERTKLEWVADSDFRFFPAVKDPQFGHVLHIVDLAVNKLMAAAGRREPRDIVDLVLIHERHLPIGAVAWAAVNVAPGFTAEGLIDEIKRNSRYTAEDFLEVTSEVPIDPAAIARRLRVALADAEAFVGKMPTAKAGLIFLENGVAVQPDPARLGDYIEHAPQRRGHWPSSSEITSAMLEKLKRQVP